MMGPAFIMARINNSDTIKEIQDGAKIQSGTEIIPNILNNQVVATMECNPKLLRRGSVIGLVYNRATTATNATLTGLSARPKQEVYITSSLIVTSQDVVSDNEFANITAVFDGATRQINSLRKRGTTAEARSSYLTYDPPLKIDRGSVVLYTLGFGAGAANSDFIVFGYIVDNAEA